jgi:hypothetical protein
MGMHKHPQNTRNEALEFARRTRRNLDFIEKAKSEGAQVHVVTQLTISLLGLVVFPKEKLLLDEAKTKTITDIPAEGWPVWTITLDDPAKPTMNLADILRHLRNAVAHGRLTFTSDNEHLADVAILVEDQWPRGLEPYWCAEIDGNDLRSFCCHFIDFVESTVG